MCGERFLFSIFLLHQLKYLREEQGRDGNDKQILNIM